MTDLKFKVEGIAALRRALKEVDVEFPGELRGINKDAAQLIVDEAVGRAVMLGGVAAHVAPSLKALSQGTSAAVRLGGARYAMALGAEFGSGHDSPRLRRAHSRRGGPVRSYERGGHTIGGYERGPSEFPRLATPGSTSSRPGRATAPTPAASSTPRSGPARATWSRCTAGRWTTWSTGRSGSSSCTTRRSPPAVGITHPRGATMPAAARKSTTPRKVTSTAKAAKPTSEEKGLRLNGTVLSIDPDDMTLEDCEDFEDHAGRPLEDMLRGEVVKDDDGRPVIDPETKRPKRTIKPRMRELAALVWIAKRREDPSFTLEQARKTKLSELELGSPNDPQ